MLGDDPERLLLAPAADQDRDAAGRHGVQLLPAGPDAGQVLRERVEPRSGGAELIAVLVVIAMRPAGTGAEDEAAHPIPSADVVDGAGHVGLQIGVAVAVAVDERAELDAVGLLGHGGEHRPGLVVEPVAVAGEGEEVVPVEDDVDAHVFEAGDAVAHLGIRGVLRGDLHADAHGTVW